MNILFTIDKGYLEHLAECVRSMIRFASEDGYDIYIMHSDLEKEDERDLGDKITDENVRLHFISMNLEEENFPQSSRYPSQIYYRIFAAFFLPEHLERVLYLDADTIVINPLDELYHMDFNGNYLLACTHIRKVLNKINRIRLGIKEDYPYINSGIMLMNLDALRVRQNYSEIAEYVKRYKRHLTLPDQDIITALYGDKIGLLDTMVYNLSDRMLAIYNADISHKKRDINWVRENTVIIHYYGKQKPWKNSYMGILDVFYKEIRDKLESGA